MHWSQQRKLASIRHKSRFYTDAKHAIDDWGSVSSEGI